MTQINQPLLKSLHHAEERNSIFSKVRNKTKIQKTQLLFNFVQEVVAYIIRQEKETRAKNIDQEEVKLSLLADDRVTHLNTQKKK